MDVTFVVQRVDMPELEGWNEAWGTPVCAVICVTVEGQASLGEGGNLYIPLLIHDIANPPSLPAVGTELTVSLPEITPRAEG